MTSPANLCSFKIPPASNSFHLAHGLHNDLVKISKNDMCTSVDHMFCVNIIYHTSYIHIYHITISYITYVMDKYIYKFMNNSNYICNYQTISVTLPHKIVWKSEGCTRIVRCLQLENDSWQTSQSEPNATIRRLRELLLFKSFLPALPPKLIAFSATTRAV